MARWEEELMPEQGKDGHQTGKNYVFINTHTFTEKHMPLDFKQYFFHVSVSHNKLTIKYFTGHIYSCILPHIHAYKHMYKWQITD